jgi:predicted transcriptional regulator of viral defense system
MMTARAELWERALEQGGLVTVDDARRLDIDPHALRLLAHRGALEHAATGVYRFTNYPYQENTPYREAVLWTGRRQSYLSHETVLEVLNLCDVNPTVIHVTIPPGNRFRRQDPRFRAHVEALSAEDVGWWEEIPAVRPAVAIRQCIEDGLPTYLVRQAISTARERRLVSAEQARKLRRQLERRSR